MKVYDKVKLINDENYYKQKNIFKGAIGTIISGEIRDNRFEVAFESNDKNDWYIYCDIKIKDLEVIEDGFATDEMILEELPLNNPKWWCKVEDGYILNLLGDKKNQTPYNYDS